MADGGGVLGISRPRRAKWVKTGGGKLSLPPASVRLTLHADACPRPIWHGAAEPRDALVLRTKFAAAFRSVLANPQEVVMAGRNVFYAQSGGVTAVINA